MASLLLFGPGYVGKRLAARLAGDGWQVVAINRDLGEDAVLPALSAATHILSTVPPGDEGDPILARYGPLIATAPARWIGYLSSTGVYGDTGGAWVDESAPIGAGRRTARAQADLAWQQLRSDASIFRLPGIYGPGRSPLERIAAGTAHRIDLPRQVFSRIHVDDILSGVIAGMAGPPGVYNLADDFPASQNDVIDYGCALIGRPSPPLQTLDEARLSPAARGFYAENRRVANGKAKRLLGWKPAFPDYRAGLRALSATTSPESVSTQPAIDSQDQT